MKLQKIVNDALSGGDDKWVKLTDPLGLAVREHGKGCIILVQLRLEELYEQPVAEKLLRNILVYACGGSDKPPLLLDEGNGEVGDALDALGVACGRAGE